jgi:hypothetical protein
VADEEKLAKIVATLGAIKTHAPDPVNESGVRLYHDQLKLLKGLGHDVQGLTIPWSDLRHFVYEADDHGNPLSQSELTFIDRASFLARIEPAFEFAQSLLDQQIAGEGADPASRATAEKIERDVALRFSRREARGNIQELLDQLLRFLISVDERLDAISIPGGPRDRLRRWIRVLDEGKMSPTDWTPMRNDLEDLFEHIRENVDADHNDFYALPAVQQRLLSYDGFIGSTMHDIEILQGAHLKSGLYAFNASRRRAKPDQPADPIPLRPEAPQAARTPVVFIGHGHSPVWRELKDYIEQVLHLETVYFEQASHVGEHMAAILDGFLARADCAVTLLTPDDEQADGRERARQNVVHETGYFQGSVGFGRVAMLIQDGVEEFSNVAGIVPIRFPGRHIKNTYGDLQMWLAREGLLK